MRQQKKFKCVGIAKCPKYCSKECQTRDWETHKFRCIETHAFSFGIFDVLADARDGVAAAQVVMGILYLRGYDFHGNSDQTLKEIDELAKRDNIYAKQARYDLP